MGFTFSSAGGAGLTKTPSSSTNVIASTSPAAVPLTVKAASGAILESVLQAQASDGSNRFTLSASGSPLFEGSNGLFGGTSHWKMSGDAHSRVSLTYDSDSPILRMGTGAAAVTEVLKKENTGRLTLNNQNGTYLDWNVTQAAYPNGKPRPLLQLWETVAGNPGGPTQTMAIRRNENQTRQPDGRELAGHALDVEHRIGNNSAAQGTAHTITSLQRIYQSAGNTNANFGSEYTPLAVYQTDYSTTNNPRIWLTDFIQVGPTTRPNLMTGFTLCVNNHYNGAFLAPGIPAAMEIVSQRWAPGWATPTGVDDDRITYAMACGLHITGSAGANLGDNTRDAFTTAIRVGGQAHGWPNAGMRVGTAIELTHWHHAGIKIHTRSDAQSTSTGPAIDIAADAGEVLARGGVATKVLGRAPVDSDFGMASASAISGMMVLDNVANPKRLYVRVGGGTWHWVALSA